jgi:hypothetical protein
VGIAGLAGLLLCAVPLAAPGTALVPSAVGDGPDWLLGLYGGGTGIGPGPYLGLLCLAFAAYLCVIAGATALPGRLLWTVITVLIAAFALAPPLLSQDVFSYISYARLDAEHGLNPYLHVPSERPADPAFAHLGWPDSVSAYGPLFTLLSNPLGSVGVPVALWVLKAVAALSVLGVAILCARLAPARGIDPRVSAAFVALNPLVLVHVVGGAHNEGLMMLAAIGGVAAVLALREGAGAGAILASAGLKVSALFIAPFALIGSARRGRFLLGAGLAAAVLAAAATIAFGLHAFDAIGLAGENQARESHRSLPHLAAQLTSAGSGLTRSAALLLYALALAWLLRWAWRGADWVRAAGWAGVALLAASAWVLPWYVLWPLPLAALSRDRLLVLAVLAFTALHLATRVPL